MHLLRAIKRHLTNVFERLAWMQKHLQQQHPKRLLAEKMQRLDFCELTLIKLQEQILTHLQHQLRNNILRLYNQNPLTEAQIFTSRLKEQYQKLLYLMAMQQQGKQAELTQAVAKLDTLSPLATLQRGYSISLNHKQQILRSYQEVKVGEKIAVKLAQGTLGCEVIEIKK